ncbi:MAG: DUF935 family protein [Phaeospirillum sp.]|nr:DUF935 family protein [Phaeospirillum sp.]
MAILDQYGNPIDIKRLAVEESGPSITGVRQILSDHPWRGMTPYRLAQVLHAAEDGDADSYLEVAEEIEEKDLHYRSVLGTRRLQVRHHHHRASARHLRVRLFVPSRSR